MIRYLMNRYALSEKGAAGLAKGICLTAIFDLAVIVPLYYVAVIVSRMLEPLVKGESGGAALSFWQNTGILAVLFVVIFTVYRMQYNSVYNNTYAQSEERRITLAEKIRRIALSYFGSRDVADIAGTMMKDCDDLEFAFSHGIPHMLGGMISSVIVGILLLFVNVKMALVMFIVIPIAWILMAASKRLLRVNDEKSYATSKAVIDGMQECIESIRELRSANYESRYLGGIYGKIDEAEKVAVKGEIIRGVLATATQSILKLGLALVILLGGVLYGRGEITLFTYLLFLLAASRFYEPISSALIFLSAIMYSDVGIDRLRDLLNAPEHDGAKECTPDSYDIVFENVGFSYNKDRDGTQNAGERVLKNLSFVAKQGQVTALVGPSGSGKSTVARLAARFWDVDEGQVRLGGVDISTVDEEALLKYYSFVFQDVVLFNNTVMENIRIGRKDATDQEVRWAAKAAAAHDFIEELPEGYSTMIGENGARLSGGQRQRISVARAILKGAPILILDEATASVDVENETELQRGLSNLIKNKTVIVIAHRMRTVRGADHVVVLDRGEKVEEGTPEELLEKGGLFAHLNELQKNV